MRGLPSGLHTLWRPATLSRPCIEISVLFSLRGMTPGRIFAQVMGRIGAPSRGRDVNTHGLGDLSLGIFDYVSHLPQVMPVALGAAMTFQYRGEKRVALTYFGDGASSEGGCHETLNLAAVFQAPVGIRS